MKILKEVKIDNGLMSLFDMADKAQQSILKNKTKDKYEKEVAKEYYVSLKRYVWAVFRLHNMDKETVKYLKIADSLEVDSKKGIVRLISYRDELNIFDKINLNCNI